MSGEPFDFDFTKVEIDHPGLDQTSATYLADTMISDVGSRARAIAALAAARRLITYDLAPGTGAKSQEALAVVAEELEQVEYALRDLEDGAKPARLVTPSRSGGRPNDSNAVVDFQARAVMATKWLQQLDAGALESAAAISAVAKTIPGALLQPHAGRDGGTRESKLDPDEQLNAWVEKAGRKSSRLRGRLHELWNEMEIERGIPLSRQTSAQVLSWLDVERARLLGN